MELVPSAYNLAMATESITVLIQRLRKQEDLNNNSYYNVLQVLYKELLDVFSSIDGVAKILIQSLNEQYAFFNTNIPPTHHLFEINMMCMLNINELKDDTVLEVYSHILQGLSLHKETYNILKFLNKLIQKHQLKQFQGNLLRQLQCLMGPSDKKCLKLATQIACYIINNWNDDIEQEKMFDKLLLQIKWLKMDFYICNSLFKNFGHNIYALKIVMERIFQGFQENHAAYGAYVLFREVVHVCLDDDNCYTIVEDDIVSILEQDINQKTLHSSILTYVIPTIADAAREKFIKRIYTFKHTYKMQVIKYYYHKMYLKEIDLNVVLDIVDVVRLDKKDRTILNLIFDLCCSSPKKNRYVEEEHFEMLMKCIKQQYGKMEPIMQHNIHTFLNHVMVSMIKKNRPLYLEFFVELGKLLKALPEKYSDPRASLQVRILMEIHVRALYLMSRTYTTLRRKFPVPNCEDVVNHPDRKIFDKYIEAGWEMIKQVSLSGIGTQYAYDLIDYHRFAYDPALINGIRTNFFISLTHPNLESLEVVRLYAKILKKIFLKFEKNAEIEILVNDLIQTLHLQFMNTKGAQDYLVHLANPVYTSGEAILIFIENYFSDDAIVYLYKLSTEIIFNTLSLIQTSNDFFAKKFIEQVLVTHLEILKHCVIKHYKLLNGHTPVAAFLRLCEYIMCLTKFRKSTSLALKVASEVVASIGPLPDDIYDYLVSRLNVHLQELEDAGLNRCSGNKEMILLTFKAFVTRKELFPIHFQRMLNASNGYHDLHLIAIEAIISEASLKNLTAPFLIEVFRKTLFVMAHPKFSNRNAATQIIQVLANRFMGTKSELDTRPVSVLHVFERYPEMANICYATLTNSTSNNSKFGVLAFIGDSPHCCSLFGEIYNIPREKIGSLLEISGLKMIATKVFAMTVNANRVYATIIDAINELHYTNVTPCSLLFVEYLLGRLINLNVKKEIVQDAFTRFECLLKTPGVVGQPGITKYLRYPCFDVYKVSLKHSVGDNIAQDVVGLIRKCFFSENYVALSFTCFYTETIFHRLEEVAKGALFYKLVEILFESNSDSYLLICQYYLTIKNIIVCYPNIFKSLLLFIDIKCCTKVYHVFVAEIVTFILTTKECLRECDMRSLNELKWHLPILFKQCDADDVTVSESIVSTLVNLSWLIFKNNFQKSDFYYLLFIALFSISNKEQFRDLFKIVTGRDDEVSYQIQRLPKIIKDDLGEEYFNFIRNISNYISSNLNHFFIDYCRLYNCSERYVNVKIDIFLLNIILKEIKKNYCY